MRRALYDGIYYNTHVNNAMVAHPCKFQYLGDWAGRSLAPHQPALYVKILRLNQRTGQREETRWWRKKINII